MKQKLLKSKLISILYKHFKKLFLTKHVRFFFLFKFKKKKSHKNRNLQKKLKVFDYCLSVFLLEFLSY